MRSFLWVLAAGVLCAAPALAQPAPEGAITTRPAGPGPTLNNCAAVYGALARQQATFGRTGSLFGQRYGNFDQIDFDARLNELSRKTEKGVTELKTLGESFPTDYYHALVDAETQGDIDTPAVNELAQVTVECDAEYDFAPPLG